MLLIAKKSQVIAARKRMMELLTPGAEEIYRRVSTPGGNFGDGKSTKVLLYWHQRKSLWVHFATKPWNDDHPRLAIAFGTDAGRENEALFPSIEINIPVNGYENKLLTSRVLVDSTGKIYLGHKGELKGGKNNVKLDDFERLIVGFEKEPIQWSDGKEERVFIIGAINAPDFTTRLREFVSEAGRIRKLAKQGALNAALKSAPPTFNAGSHGKGMGQRSSEYDIERYHDKIVEELHRQLKAHKIAAFNNKQKETAPDLYTLLADKTIDLLFEVKTKTDTQSWYTAIGQLCVYGAIQENPPKRILVCPSSRKDPNFKAAFDQLNIKILRYEMDSAGDITFPSLEKILRK